jgi:hypothetical protein
MPRRLSEPAGVVPKEGDRKGRWVETAWIAGCSVTGSGQPQATLALEQTLL